MSWINSSLPNRSRIASHGIVDAMPAQKVAGEIDDLRVLGRDAARVFSRIAVIVASGTSCRRAPPVCAPQTYIASNSRATTIAASTRTRMSSEPSKRT